MANYRRSPTALQNLEDCQTSQPDLIDRAVKFCYADLRLPDRPLRPLSYSSFPSSFRPPAANHAIPFFDDQLLIDRLLFNPIHVARGPVHDDGIGLRSRPQAEMQPGIAGRFETAVGPDLGALLQPAGRHLHPGPEAVAIGLFAHRPDAQPVSLPGGQVTQEHWRAV